MLYRTPTLWYRPRLLSVALAQKDLMIDLHYDNYDDNDIQTLTNEVNSLEEHFNFRNTATTTTTTITSTNYVSTNMMHDDEDGVNSNGCYDSDSCFSLPENNHRQNRLVVDDYDDISNFLRERDDILKRIEAKSSRSKSSSATTTCVEDDQINSISILPPPPCLGFQNCMMV